MRLSGPIGYGASVKVIFQGRGIELGVFAKCSGEVPLAVRHVQIKIDFGLMWIYDDASPMHHQMR